MAKTSVIAREAKRAHLVKKYAAKRATLKEQFRKSTNPDEQMKILLALQGLPRNASKIRQRNRCKLTGRPRGVYRKFGLGRSMLRIHAMRGDIPGLVKSSW